MPRKEFILSFPKNETSHRWLQKQVKGGKKWSNAMGRLQEEISRRQDKLAPSREDLSPHDHGHQGDQP